MKMQRDFFTSDADVVELEPSEHRSVRSADISAEPIAVPCGFIDKTNHRCSRHGERPVLIDGHQMVSRGRPMVHCDPACFGVRWEFPAPEEDGR